MSLKSSDTHRNAANSESPLIKREQNVAPAGSWAKGKVAALVLAVLQSVAPMTPVDVFGGSVPVAEAVLTNPNTRIPKAGDVALRRAIPALNVETKKMQELIEELSYLLRIPQRKPYGSMAKNTKEALEIATKSKDAILNAVGPQFRQQAEGIYASLIEGRTSYKGLLEAIDAQDADVASVRIQAVLNNLAQLELLQAPALPFTVPAQYSNLPRLNGRATVALEIARKGGDKFVLKAGGGAKDTATLELVLDGYSAPITAGNFADLISRQAFDGVQLIAGQQSIITKGDIPAAQGRVLPLEIKVAGEFEPEYRTQVDVQGGEIPILPISVYGAVVAAHDPSSEALSSASQMFFYLYDRKFAGLGGLSFDEGQFSVFGYITKGIELLSQFKTGDVIQSARITEGAERLNLPSS
ncbi:cyclophilin-like peptidyl-prolyl cis-trans isomerase family protein [Klebsormidium nitens]|uniref:Cyclophilin-like peptidyl-prolyl cis-trans isomerase family protein n=1 Tax=Klebsormidium nitens TaxID=105231 RepID=A0A1Y1I5B1_KLENI|nr:cyclophilin-like peptidyl-prolyl cis-trans isomerase family protein [Klebsormidium nitens]|eukprot:GAQ83308.1 cyclophilin-like peptidyl-prolyl cis-trans isomerase family protein [Klebsormidium nitens]